MLDNAVMKIALAFWLNLRNNAIKKTPTVFFMDYIMYYLLVVLFTIKILFYLYQLFF